MSIARHFKALQVWGPLKLLFQVLVRSSARHTAGSGLLNQGSVQDSARQTTDVKVKTTLIAASLSGLSDDCFEPFRVPSLGYRVGTASDSNSSWFGLLRSPTALKSVSSMSDFFECYPPNFEVQHFKIERSLCRCLDSQRCAILG